MTSPANLEEVGVRPSLPLASSYLLNSVSFRTPRGLAFGPWLRYNDVVDPPQPRIIRWEWARLAHSHCFRRPCSLGPPVVTRSA